MSFRIAPLLAAMASLTLLSHVAQAADAEVEKVFVKSVAHFDFDDSTIRGSDQPGLLDEVGKIKNVTWQSITATGYTDDVGARSYNERLSKRRAAAVKAYLVGHGIVPSSIRIEGKASDQPIAPNTTDEGRATNRRTEIQFQGIRTAGN